jgi:hypothetical protein
MSGSRDRCRSSHTNKNGSGSWQKDGLNTFRKKNKDEILLEFFERFSQILKNIKKEIVKILLLNPKLHFIEETTISKVSLNVSIVHSKGHPTPIQQGFEITYTPSKIG